MMRFDVIRILTVFLKNDLNLLLMMFVLLGIMMRHEQRRSHFPLRLASVTLLLIAVCIAGNLWYEVDQSAMPGIAKFTTILLLTFAGVMFCYDTQPGYAMINVSAFFCIEHIAQRGKGLICALVFPRITFEQQLIVLYVLSVPLVIFYYLLFERNRTYHSERRRIEGIQLFVAIMVVLSDIVYSMVFAQIVRQTNAVALSPMSSIASIIFSLLCLVICQCHMITSEARYHLEITRRQLEEERAHFQRDQSTIDALNIKAHDLKHQLNALNEHLPDSARKALQDAVQQYDIICHTGHPALDVVISSKSLLCFRHNIQFTYLTYGACLSFLQDMEIYSLFGNLLDNAIEASEKNDDPEYRVISLTVHAQNGIAVIHTENYYCGQLRFHDGLPVTTRPYANEHGFGLRSIRSLAEQYHGSMEIHVDQNIFSVDILLPIPKEAARE